MSGAWILCENETTNLCSITWSNIHISTLLKTKNNSFVGIQILIIGDLLQLPPVVQDEEWDYLAPYYPGVHYLNPAKYKLFTAEYQNPLSVSTRAAFRAV